MSKLTIMPQPMPAYSLVRFSTPQQALGDTQRRQVEGGIAYAAAHGLTVVETITDNVSGFHGVNRKRGALGRFVTRFRNGEIAPGVLICEAFDRFSREPPRIVQQSFLELINAGMDVVTLIDGQRYSAASIDANIGQIYVSIGMMLGAHQESKNKAVRIREGWTARRTGTGKHTGMPSANCPSWIAKTKSGFVLDKEKHKVIKRIFKLAVTTGTAGIAVLLNQEQVPTFCTRKRARPAAMWDKATIRDLIRGRQVLGEQEVFSYGENRIREKTGRFEARYPAAVSEKEHDEANAAIDGRKKGTHTGRNAGTFANLFGNLAFCARCQSRMKIRKRTGRPDFSALVCSAAAQGACPAKRSFPLRIMEKEFLGMLGPLAYREQNQDGRVAAITAQIAGLKQETTKMQASLEAMVIDYHIPSIRAASVKIAKDRDDKVAHLKTLERELAAVGTAKPANALASIKRYLHPMDDLSPEKRIEARGRIAAALPMFISSIFFEDDPDGWWTVTLKDRFQITGGGGMYGVGAQWKAVGPFIDGLVLSNGHKTHTIKMPVSDKVKAAMKANVHKALEHHRLTGEVPDIEQLLTGNGRYAKDDE